MQDPGKVIAKVGRFSDLSAVLVLRFAKIHYSIYHMVSTKYLQSK